MTPEERSARAKKAAIAAAKERRAERLGGTGGEADGAAWQESADASGQMRGPSRKSPGPVFVRSARAL
jgi:hypothetical protein